MFAAHGVIIVQPSERFNRQAVAVPAARKVAQQSAAVRLLPVLENFQHRIASDAAKRTDPHGDVQLCKAFGDDEALGGQHLLRVHARLRGVQQQVDAELRLRILAVFEEDHGVVQHRQTPGGFRPDAPGFCGLRQMLEV